VPGDGRSQAEPNYFAVQLSAIGEMGHDHPGAGSLSIAHALVDGDGH
jgi:hypothetical protein